MVGETVGDGILKSEPPFQLLNQSSVPGALIEVVRRCLQKNRDDRFSPPASWPLHSKALATSRRRRFHRRRCRRLAPP
jgi:hypothetical protein